MNWLNKQNSAARSVALGTFDGVHRGHQKLLEAALAQRPPQGTSAVFTFDRPPQQFFQPKARLLISFAQKVQLLQERGIEEIAWLPFNKELASLEARDFVLEILLKELKAQHVVCGFNFRFGKERSGDPSLLKQMAGPCGFSVTVVPPVKFENGQVISSTLIREFLERGEIGQAAALLGYFPFYEALVGFDAARGRQIGFPAANLAVDPLVLLPKEGVYLTWCLINPTTGRPALTSVSKNPTLNGTVWTVETYILDFRAALDNQKIQIQFLKRLRDRVSFPTAAAQQKQIRADVDLARELLPGFRLQGAKIVLE